MKAKQAQVLCAQVGSRLFTTITAAAMALICFLSANASAWTVHKVEGSVQLIDVHSAKASGGSTVQVAVELKAGQGLQTGADGKVQLVDGESEIWIAPSSRFEVHQLADLEKSKMGRLDLLKGRLRAKFKRPSGPEVYPYEVKLHSVVAGVRGTEFFVEVDGGKEQVCTLEGLVRVSAVKSAAESWDVAAGHGLYIKPGEMPKVRETAADQQKKWIEATAF